MKKWISCLILTLALVVPSFASSFDGNVVTKTDVLSRISDTTVKNQWNKDLKDIYFYNAEYLFKTQMKLTTVLPTLNSSKSITNYTIKVNNKSYECKNQIFYDQAQKKYWIGKALADKIASDNQFIIILNGTTVSVQKGGFTVAIGGVSLTEGKTISLTVGEFSNLTGTMTDSKGKKSNAVFSTALATGKIKVDTKENFSQIYLYNGQYITGNKATGKTEVTFTYLNNDKKTFTLKCFVDVSYNPNLYGNSDFNIKNKAFLVNKIDALVFNPIIPTLDQSSFKLDLPGITEKYPQLGSYLNYGYGRAFYIDKTSGNIKSMSFTGRNVTTISSDEATSLFLYGEWLYYKNANDNGKLYRIHESMTTTVMDNLVKKQKVTDENIIGDYYSFYSGNLIFVDTQKRLMIAKINNNFSGEPLTTQPVQLVQDYVSNYIVSGDYILYTNTSGQLYRTKINQKTPELLSKEAVHSYTLYSDGYVYYLDENNRLCRFENGNKVELLKDYAVSPVSLMNIAGGQIYFYTIGDYNTLYKYDIKSKVLWTLKDGKFVDVAKINQ